MLQEHRTALESQQHSRNASGLSAGSDDTVSSDAQDAIVLLDLVRTGEASRLRRRGAIRLDRHLNHFSEHDSDEENWHYSHRERSYRNSQSSSRWVSHLGEEQEPDEEEPSFNLVCGAEVAPTTWDYDSEPFEPSILPIPLEPAKTSSTLPNMSRRTNGCGAVIHFNASLSTSSRGGSKTYVARSRATETVVSMPAEYFHDWPGVKFEKSSCGCIKEGIGCSVCGNALGTRWTFCKTMAEGRRKGPWRRSAASRSSSRSREEICLPNSTSSPDDYEDAALYTFFGNAVTAYRDETPKAPILMPPTEPNSPIFAPASPHYQQPTWRTAARESGYEDEVHPFSFRSPLATNAESTIVRSFSDSMGPQRRNSEPIYGYQMTASPEPVEVPLPDFDDGDRVLVSADGRSESLRQPVRIVHVESSPIRFATELSDDEDDLGGQPMSFYHEQILGALQRERPLRPSFDSDGAGRDVGRGVFFFSFDR